MPTWLVDGNNVYGSRPDGWWRDRPGAARRLVAAVERWRPVAGGPVVVVFDGRPDQELARAGSDVEVVFATRTGPNAADDTIVELVEARFAAEAALIVVTSDRGLIGRLPSGVRVEGSRAFLGLLEGADGQDP